MSVRLFDGTSFGVGDVNSEFSIQSISKVFTFTLALHQYGRDLYQRQIGTPLKYPGILKNIFSFDCK